MMMAKKALLLVVLFVLLTGCKPAPGDTRTRSTDDMVMVYAAAGEFAMGSKEGDADAWEHEFPQHLVALDSFWIDQTEVTNAQYRLCVEAGMCAEPACWNEPDLNAPEQPVVCVTWEDAQTYCAWAGARLPTEAEWEYAARGTEGRLYPWGSEFDGSKLNFCDANCPFPQKDDAFDDGYAFTAPVGSYPDGASWCGALDMAGNVWEWVADWFDSGYYTRSLSQNPQGPEEGEIRALRGGAWRGNQRGVRSTGRVGISPDSWHPDVGIRCAVSAEE